MGTTVTEFIEHIDMRAFVAKPKGEEQIAIVEMRITSRTRPDDHTSLRQSPNYSMPLEVAELFLQLLAASLAEARSKLAATKG